MCVGIPYCIVEPGFGFARATSRGREAVIDTRLVGDLAPGAWVLTFLGAAREVLSQDEAQRIENALEAVGRAMAGETDLDRFFADLVGPDRQAAGDFRSGQITREGR